MAANYPINPRVRAYGKARLDIAQRARTPDDWRRLWLPPAQPFPFEWGGHWKQCVEYIVDDFAAEVGFYIDVLGLPVNALDPDYAMFTSPGGDFYFAVVPARGRRTSTPSDAIRLQFMLADILATTEELEKRGIEFEAHPSPVQEGSDLYIGCFRSPHGIPIELWGIVGDDEDDMQISFDFDASNGRLTLENHIVDEKVDSSHLEPDTLNTDPEKSHSTIELDDEDENVRYEDIEDKFEDDEEENDYEYEDLME